MTERYSASNLPHERRPMQEYIPIGGYDAVMVHGFWISRVPGEENTFEGSERTKLAADAAALLFGNGTGVGVLVSPTGYVKGPHYPSTADVTRDEMMKFGIPNHRFIADPQAYNTIEEIAVFRRLAYENGWNNVATVTFEDHSSAKRYFPDGTDGLHVTHLSVEHLLRAYDTEGVFQQRLADLQKMRYKLGYKGYELAKAAVDMVPGATVRLGQANKRARTQRNDSLFNDILLHQIDIFNS